MALGTAVTLGLLGAAGTAASVASNNSATKAQVGAANTQAQLALTGQREQIAAQKEAQDQIIALTAPQRQAGQNALAQMMQMTASPFDPGEYEASDAYKFQLEQGQDAMGSMASARGISRSGAAMKDAMRFSQGLASQDERNWRNQQLNEHNQGYNKLMSIANIGSGAQGQQIGAIQNSASNIGNAIQMGSQAAGNAFMNAGNARASGYQRNSNALQGMFGDAASAIGMYQGGWFDNQKPLSGMFS